VERNSPNFSARTLNLSPVAKPAIKTPPGKPAPRRTDIQPLIAGQPPGLRQKLSAAAGMQRVNKEVRELQAQTKQKISTVFVQFLRDHSSFAKKRWGIQGEVAGAKAVYAGMIQMACEYALLFKQDHALSKTDPDGLNMGLVMDAFNTMLDAGVRHFTADLSGQFQ
jgi:hypothetical protein